MQRGFIVYALDIQSHGLSDGWMGERCNFEAFDNVAYDVIQAFQYVKNNAQFQHDCSVNSSKLPLFGVGISFGGAVLARAMELASQQSLLPPTAITGIVLLAPALALDTVAQQGIHACAAPFAGLISSAFPRVKVFAPVRNLFSHSAFKVFSVKHRYAGMFICGVIRSEIFNLITSINSLRWTPLPIHSVCPYAMPLKFFSLSQKFNKMLQLSFLLCLYSYAILFVTRCATQQGQKNSTIISHVSSQTGKQH